MVRLKEQKMIAYATIKDIIVRSKTLDEASDMLEKAINAKDLIDIDRAVEVCETLYQKKDIDKVPARGTIQNWVCSGRLMKRGYRSMGPQTGRPKVLISQSDLINLLNNYPKAGRPEGWRKPKELQIAV